jgi:hypothetical protein
MTKAGDFGRRRRIAPFFASLRKAASSARLPSARGISSAEKNSRPPACTPSINARKLSTAICNITLRSAVTSAAFFWASGWRRCSVARGSEVAVLLLGNAFSFEGDVRIVPADASSDLASVPDRLETETLRLSDFLRRVSSRLPRNLVVIVDECADLDPAGGKCSQSVGSTGASIFSAFRRASTATADRNLSNALSLRTNLLSLMTREGLSFSQLRSELARQLSGSNLALDASEPLSETFAFLPRGFFGGVSNECNQVDLAADATLIRSVDLAPQQTDAPWHGPPEKGAAANRPATRSGKVRGNEHALRGMRSKRPQRTGGEREAASLRRCRGGPARLQNQQQHQAFRAFLLVSLSRQPHIKCHAHSASNGYLVLLRSRLTGVL